MNSSLSSSEFIDCRLLHSFLNSILWYKHREGFTGMRPVHQAAPGDAIDLAEDEKTGMKFDTRLLFSSRQVLLPIGSPEPSYSVHRNQYDNH